MKKIIFCTFLAYLFALGNTAFALSNQLDGGIVLVAIISGKTGMTLQVVSDKNSTPMSIQIPQKYVDKTGTLTLPIEMTLSQDGKLVYQGVSHESGIHIPLTAGLYELNVKVGTYNASINISI